MAYQILHPRDTKIEGVLFDMDGVILDSEKLYAKFWAAGCAFYGYNMNYQQALGMRSLSAEAGPISAAFSARTLSTARFVPSALN